jgi:flagellar hook-associated protein 3 FlgL
MIISSATVGSEWFLNGTSILQQQLTQTQRQLSSGYKVQDASDSPSQTPELVGLGSSLAAVQAYQANLVRVQTEASGADTALSSSISLLDRARTLAVQAANTTTTPDGLAAISTEIQGIQQQLVSIANTSVEGRYIFGGNQDQSAPYNFDTPTGTILPLTTSTAPRVITDTQGQPVYQGLTAQQIFDPQDPATGISTGNSTIAALQSLQTALQSGNQPSIASAVGLLESASAYVNQQEAYYGTSEQRLTSEQNNAVSQSTALQTSIAGIRDTNVAQAATDLSQETAAQSAAVGAEAEISQQKSLFSYLA